jgi:hypothetical protein
MKLNAFVILLAAFFMLSCMEDKLSPESALKNFVEARFDAVVTKNFILERVTGKLKQGLENTTDEEFAKFSDLRNMKKDSFKILTKSCQEKQCFITYSVSYKTFQNDKSAFSTEVKKIAELEMIDGKWLIADVSNVKTYVEAIDPINPLE